MNDAIRCRFSGRPIVEGDLVLMSEAGPGIGNTVWDESQSPPTTYRLHDTGPHVFLRLGEPLRPTYAWRPAYILLKGTSKVVFVSHFEIDRANEDEDY